MIQGERNVSEIAHSWDVRDYAIDRLRRLVIDFVALEHSSLREEQLYHRVLGAVYRICDAILDCEEASMSRDEIVVHLEPVRRIHARSPFVERLQTWPRGYAGDFETVEYLMSGTNRAFGPLARACEAYALSRSIAQQHRNKVHHQAARLMRAMLAKPRTSRIASIACGSCPDLRLIRDHLETMVGELWLNDQDRDALAFSAASLSPQSERWQFHEADALTFARRLPREAFDLVLAGGLFDYLDSRAATLLIRLGYRSLAPGGALYFTNIAKGNPYRTLIEYFGDWKLIERTEDDILRDCAAAGIDRESVAIRRDETGLALLIEVTRR